MLAQQKMLKRIKEIQSSKQYFQFYPSFLSFFQPSFIKVSKINNKLPNIFMILNSNCSTDKTLFHIFHERFGH